MKSFIKNMLLGGLFAIILVFFLTKPKLTGDYAYIGLDTWYKSMIISLLPIMILVNLLMESELYKPLMKPFSKLLYPILRLSEEGVFVLFFGFLSGFPIGAKLTSDLYRKRQISKPMAEYLLAFTNNIGPAYFTGFVLTTICPQHTKSAALFIMYGIPLIYGILLRHTIYNGIRSGISVCSKITLSEPVQQKTILSKAARSKTIRSKADCSKTNRSKTDWPETNRPKAGRSKADWSKTNQPETVPSESMQKSVPSLVSNAISASLSQIAMLGGYMIFFNALRVIPHTLFQTHPVMEILSHVLLEISGGLKCLQVNLKMHSLYLMFVHAALSFGGLCCFFQTMSLLEGTDLSAKKYMLHKIILCSISSIACYLYIRRC